MKIKKWVACVQGRGKWKEVVEKAKTFNQEVQRLEEDEEMMHIFCEGKDSVLLRLCGKSNFVLLATSSSCTFHFAEKLV